MGFRNSEKWHKSSIHDVFDKKAPFLPWASIFLTFPEIETEIFLKFSKLLQE